MHEMSITESILQVALEESKNHGDRKIRSLTLHIGRLRQIIPETLRFCYEVMSKDTLAEGASVHIKEIPILAHCSRCNKDVEVDDFTFICPDCGMGGLETLQGDELILAHMELE